METAAQDWTWRSHKRSAPGRRATGQAIATDAEGGVSEERCVLVNGLAAQQNDEA